MNERSTVLIVDDDARNLRLLELLLSQEGYRTVVAADGPAALAAVNAESIDLVVLDVRMPEMDGYQVAKAIKADAFTHNIPIIMMTAHMDRASRLAGLEAGVEEFLTVPIDRAELWLRARNLVRLKKYADLLEDQALALELKVQERSADLQRFRFAMDATADALYLVNRSTMRLVEFNATAENLFGYTRDELLRLGPQDLGGPSKPELEAIFDRLIAGDVSDDLLEIEARRKDGSVFVAEVQLHAHRSSAEWVLVGVLRDITKRKSAEEKLHHLAHYDTLTGLPNRALFYTTLEQQTATALTKGWTLAVMFLDIDHFKNVNDTLGHAAGDELLVQVSERLVQCVRIRDTIGRLGGDEFALILVMKEGRHGVNAVALKILAELSKPFDIGDQKVLISASIGITVHPHDAQDAATLLKYADTAMYRAKEAGRNTFRFFTPEMNAELLASMELARALREAIDREEFVLHYQPKVQLSTGSVVGVEALLRWERPGHGLVAPNDFIPVLEATGLIIEVGAWVIGEACRQIAAWSTSTVGDMRIAVNVAGQQFMSGDVDADVAHALSATGIPGGLLELELTESSMLNDSDSTRKTLQSLKSRGVHLSIDDFGTGYSSLAYLRHFPIDKLKIDVAFIRHVTEDADDAVMVRTIICMARSLRLDVVAEGVETAAQLSFLNGQGCDQVQGFFVSRPLPADELEVWLRTVPALSASLSETRDRRITLLLVDDDPTALAALETLLSADGYRILTASSGSSAFDQLALHRVDAIVCDDDLSGQDGTELCSMVKRLHPDVLRVVLSESKDLTPIIEARNRGALHAYYTKPWDDADLVLDLRELLWQQHQLLRDMTLSERDQDVRPQLDGVEALAIKGKPEAEGRRSPAGVRASSDASSADTTCASVMSSDRAAQAFSAPGLG